MGLRESSKYHIDTRAVAFSHSSSWPRARLQQLLLLIRLGPTSPENLCFLPARLGQSKRKESFKRAGLKSGNGWTISKKKLQYKIILFRRHQKSHYHIEAVRAVSSSQPNVADMLSRAHSEERERNGRMLITILQSLQFLTRQGLALRGHNDSDSNFLQLLKLRATDHAEAIYLAWDDACMNY